MRTPEVTSAPQAMATATMSQTVHTPVALPAGIESASSTGLSEVGGAEVVLVEAGAVVEGAAVVSVEGS